MNVLPVCGANRDDGLIGVQLQSGEIRHDHKHSPINVICALKTVSSHTSC
jgi:hypothetical protein